MFRVKTSFAYIIKINKIICIKVCAWSSALAEWGILGNIFVRWERDGGEENYFPDIGRCSWNGMLCFMLLSPWIFTFLRQTWAINIPGNSLRGVRWLWQLLWVATDDCWFSQSSPGFYWSDQSSGEILVIGYEYLSHIIFHLCRHPGLLCGVIQYCWSQ